MFASFSPYPFKVPVRVVTAPIHGQSYSSRSCVYSEAHAHDALSTGGSISRVLMRTMARKMMGLVCTGGLGEYRVISGQGTVDKVR